LRIARDAEGHVAAVSYSHSRTGRISNLPGLVASRSWMAMRLSPISVRISRQIVYVISKIQSQCCAGLRKLGVRCAAPAARHSELMFMYEEDDEDDEEEYDDEGFDEDDFDDDEYE